MKRNIGSQKFFYNVLSLLVVFISVGLIAGTLYTVWNVYGELIRVYPAEPQAPQINDSLYQKVTDIVKKKQQVIPVDIEAKTREVKFGKPEPFAK